MANAQVIRFGILGTALAATVVASIYPNGDEPSEAVPSKTRDGSQSTIFSINAPRRVSVAVANTGTEDPFAPRQWVVPATASPVPAVESVRIDVQIAQPLQPPPQPVMPYRFSGRLADGNDIVLYISRGDQVFAVKDGDVIEGQYKVTAIEDRKVKLQHLESGEQYSLALPSADN